MSELPADLHRLSREALIERVQVLERQVVELLAEIERLKRAGKRQATPFSKGEREKNPKKPGRRPGQGRFTYRTPPEASELTEPPVAVAVAEPVCPGCGAALEPAGTERAWRTELRPLPRPEVTEYRVEVARCTGCGKRVRGAHPEVAADQRGATAHRLGPRLRAAAHVLHYGIGIPVRKVPAVLGELCGVAVTQSALTQAALREGVRGAAGSAYDELLAEVPSAPVVYTDPTGWRVAGEAAQLSVFATEQATLYRITERYRSNEVRDVIGGHYGDAYAGVLVGDRARVFDARTLSGVRQQKCLAHVLRSLSEVLEGKKGRARDFAAALSALLREAIGLWKRRQAGRICAEACAEAYGSEATRVRSEVAHLLRERRLTDPDNQRLLNELGTHHDRGNLLRFLEEAGVEPTNNRSERDLRPGVIARKVSQCSKSWGGAEAHAIFCSLIRTSMQREARSLVDALMRVLTSGQPPPLPAR